MWPSWGARAAGVCREVRKKVDAQLADTDTAESFAEFVAALRGAVGDHLTEDQAAEMVAQHVVTIPIFDCLFADSQFANTNPISVAINNLLVTFAPADDTTTEAADGSALAMELFEEELRPLTRAYRTMRTVFEGALTAAAKADVLREVYDGFFKAAMQDVVRRLGVVYTPVQIVDFMVRSADAVCRKEFGVGITSENVNILDPFTGTGHLHLPDAHRPRRQRQPHHPLQGCSPQVLLGAVRQRAGAVGLLHRGHQDRGRNGRTRRIPAGLVRAFPRITFGDTFLATAGGAQLPGNGRQHRPPEPPRRRADHHHRGKPALVDRAESPQATTTPTSTTPTSSSGCETPTANTTAQ